MPRLDAGLMPVVVDLERGLRELGIFDLFRWYRLGTGL